MTRTKRTDWQVRNALGTTLSTHRTAEAAKDWAIRFVDRFPSVRVVRVTLTVETETTFWPSASVTNRKGVAA